MKGTFTIVILLCSAFCRGQPSVVDNVQRQTTNNIIASQTGKDTDTASGVIYFSMDNGATWVNRSQGLPEDIHLTDIAVAGGQLGLATKQHGIFLFNESTTTWKATTRKPPTTDNLNALYIYGTGLFVGSQNSGVFVSKDQGESWTTHNNGLGNLTIRKFALADNKLYVGTNGGLYVLDEEQNTWVSAFQSSSFQVNGFTEFQGDLYVGTNRGAFRAKKGQRLWKEIMPDQSLHNISSDDRTVYALSYNGLFASMDKGSTWLSIQKGLPEGLYSFQLLKKDDAVLVGQWDGIYKRPASQNWLPVSKEWTLWSNGLPNSFAVTEMQIFKNAIVIGCSKRKLRKGVSIIK